MDKKTITKPTNKAKREIIIFFHYTIWHAKTLYKTKPHMENLVHHSTMSCHHTSAYSISSRQILLFRGIFVAKKSKQKYQKFISPHHNPGEQVCSLGFLFVKKKNPDEPSLAPRDLFGSKINIGAQENNSNTAVEKYRRSFCGLRKIKSKAFLAVGTTL